MFLSIIVPTFQRPTELARCLNSIDLVDDFEIIVSDNASPYDVSQCIPEQLRARCRLVVQKENLGARENIFRASHLAKGEYTIYITDDDFFLPGELKVLAEQLSACRPNVAYAPCIINYEKQNRRKYYGFLPKWFGRAGLINRGHILSGLVVKTPLLKELLAVGAKELRNSWYFSSAILCMVQNNIYLHKRPLLIHTWENETFWGIDPGDHGVLKTDQEQLFVAMRSAEYLRFMEYWLLRLSLKKYASIVLMIAYFIERSLNYENRDAERFNPVG